jgi:hypothetical protein
MCLGKEHKELEKIENWAAKYRLYPKVSFLYIKEYNKTTRNTR